jgi:hypothetical protein
MAPTACINSLLCSVIEEFKCKESERNSMTFLNAEKVGREKLLAKILGKSRSALVLRKQIIIIFRMF